jgi:hypothetical protein
MKWAEFIEASPEIARLGDARMRATELLMLGTLRRDGSPRISPIEFMVRDGDLYLGMMWRSRKALDLLRDNRCVLHSTTSNKDGSEGDFKLYGRAIEVTDEATRQRLVPDESQFHLFTIDITEAAYVSFSEGKQETKRWRAP